MDDLALIEQIKNLKARYFRTLDANEWEAFGDCLSENCEATYSDGRYRFSGREAIVGFMAKHMSGDELLSMHNGHHPEITLDDCRTAASGVWYLNDTVIHLGQGTRLYGAAIYDDRYVLEDQTWRIASIGYSRLFECVEPLPEGHKVLSNRFAKG